ncbi:WD40/YVTN/BNR-like repeat-containing protein, partial [Aquiflexum sp.]|uniref:WD40/YVTN/BNR-like repeat-containing protein n=1 Tax=Aquiflexum sp. TaxID=1872584 RepID=UPI003593B9F5
PVWGDWQIFANRMRVFVNPYAPSEIWAGGQGAIENGFLVYIKEEEEQNQWNGLVPNPTVVKKVVFDKQSPQGIYVGWEGELAKTTDNGATWKTLIDRHEEAHFFMGIGISQNDPNLVFAGKWIKIEDPQPLELYYSQDKGNTWKTMNFPGVDFGGVYDLIVKSESDRERIFVGLDKGGVYEIIMSR